VSEAPPFEPGRAIGASASLLQYPVTIGNVSMQIATLAQQVSHVSARQNDVFERLDTLRVQLAAILQDGRGDPAERITPTPTPAPKSMTEHLRGLAVYGLPVATVVSVLFQVLTSRFPEMGTFMRRIFDAAQ